MRYLIACMLVGLSAGYAQEVADEAPVEVTTTDEGGDQIATTDSMKLHQSGNQGGKKGCGCGGKPK